MANVPDKVNTNGSKVPDERPLTHDELVKMENAPPLEAVPADIAGHLTTRRVIVSGLKESIQPERLAGEVPGHFWRLPKGAYLGLPGGTAMRLPPGAEKKPTTREVTFAPYRPKWVEQVYHPKRTIVPPWTRGPIERPGTSGEVFWGMYPPEEREVYYPSGYPWQCMGKIYAWNDPSSPWPAWEGTGVLIGDRLVLTAGHVVPWDAATWMMQFIPAYYDGKSILGDGAASYVSDVRGWDVSYFSRLPDAYDIAILRLYDPIGSWIGYFGSKPYWKGNPEMRFWNIIGYPMAIAGGQRPSYQPGIEVLDVKTSGDAIEIDHHGDTSRGNSGGPFWATWPDGFPYATGTVSGGRILTSGGNVFEDTNVAAGGVALNELIRWGRTNWPR